MRHQIKENSFAEACYNQNSIQDLEKALNEKANKSDCKAWEITANEWREQIKLALAARKEDLQEENNE